MDGVGSVAVAGGGLSGSASLDAAPLGGLGVGGLETERLEAEITTLAGHIAAATCRWLSLVAEFDRRRAWADWGCTSCAHWLSWQCAMGLRAAREHVRVARALDGLPAIRAAFADGRLSYSQARALTRVAEPESEESLLELARHATAAQLEQLVRGYSKASALREEARNAYDRRELTWRHDHDGSVVIQARLAADDGALVLAALQRAADRLRDSAGRGDPPPTSTGTAVDGSAEHSASPAPPRALMADALCELARGSRDGDPMTDDFQVVVNVDLESLVADAPGGCRLACGTVLAPETARRLACDQHVVALHHTDGRPHDSARKTRFASARMNRVLDRRDGGCRFPGCTHTRHLHTHHIVHWADGGATSHDNLVRLCSHHHRLIHEGGYTITKDPTHELVFRRPDGHPLTDRSPRHLGRTAAVITLNHDYGVHPGPSTITPAWNGDPLDLHWAVACLLDTGHPQGHPASMRAAATTVRVAREREPRPSSVTANKQAPTATSRATPP